MLVREIISESALPVARTDTVGDALSLAISRGKIGDLPFDAPSSVSEDAHIYDAVHLLVESEADVLPVVSTDGKYVGSVGLDNVLKPFASLLAANVQGSIVEVELPAHDFSLRHLVQAVEETGAHVLSLGTDTSDQARGTIAVVVKTSADDTSRLRAVIEHLGYHVRRSTGRSIQEDELEHRVAELMHYLDV
jgi:CBS domain-containing protein